MGKRECFSIDSGVIRVFIISFWLLNVYMDVVMKELKMGRGMMGVRFLEKGGERMEITCPLVCS